MTSSPKCGHRNLRKERINDFLKWLGLVVTLVVGIIGSVLYGDKADVVSFCLVGAAAALWAVGARKGWFF